MRATCTVARNNGIIRIEGDKLIEFSLDGKILEWHLYPRYDDIINYRLFVRDYDAIRAGQILAEWE